MPQLEDRRAEIASALHEVVELEFWNAGGSGSIETSAADPAVTEVTAGSGLLVPGLFDHYRSFSPAARGLLRAAGRPTPLGDGRDRGGRWPDRLGPVRSRTAPPSPGPRPGCS